MSCNVHDIWVYFYFEKWKSIRSMKGIKRIYIGYIALGTQNWNKSYLEQSVILRLSMSQINSDYSLLPKKNSLQNNLLGYFFLLFKEKRFNELVNNNSGVRTHIKWFRVINSTNVDIIYCNSVTIGHEYLESIILDSFLITLVKYRHCYVISVWACNIIWIMSINEHLWWHNSYL